MPVWFWVIALFFLLIMGEELVYYLWNRCIYGVNTDRKIKWKNRMNAILHFLKRKRRIDMQEIEKQKSSQ